MGTARSREWGPVRVVLIVIGWLLLALVAAIQGILKSK